MTKGDGWPLLKRLIGVVVYLDTANQTLWLATATPYSRESKVWALGVAKGLLQMAAKELAGKGTFRDDG